MDWDSTLDDWIQAEPPEGEPEPDQAELDKHENEMDEITEDERNFNR